MRVFGLSLAAASRLVSRNPATRVGLDVGEIRVGGHADLVLLAADLSLRATVVRGRRAYLHHDAEPKYK